MGLTILSYSEEALKLVKQQIINLIGDLTKIKSCSYNDLIDNPTVIKDDLILITAADRLNIFLPYIDKNSKYIIARRIINPIKIKDILEIEDDAEVLVVNEEKNSSIAMITELEAMGIKLKMTPYDPNFPLQDKNFDYAITPSYSHLVPKNIPRIIDVGKRLLSIITISQIIYHFTGSLEYDNLIFSRYIKDFILLSKEILDKSKQNLLLQKQMENIINHFESGIIILDNENNISFYNKAAATYIGKTNFNNKPLNKLIPDFSLDQESSIHTINNNSVHISRVLLNLEPNNTIKMLILKDFELIRSVDEQLRKYEKHQGHQAKHNFEDIIYKSEKMALVINKAKRFARTNSTILIQGESGTGKEIIAQAIHNASIRSDRPFVAINCAALNESLLESELFGYESGAFTGALKGGKKGLFEQAHTGTIFLDEIGDAPISIQTKLLRVLEEKEILRVSGEKVIPVDVRVIAATNQNLKELVDKGVFRHDLYYRLHVLPIHIPPLRERASDIPILLDYYITKFSKENNIPKPTLSDNIKTALLYHDWSGNVREIINISMYIVNISTMQVDMKEDLKKILSPRISNVNSSENNPVYEFPSVKVKKDCLALLDIIYKFKDNISPGRKRLTNLLSLKGIYLSEQQVRSRLKLLQQMNLIKTSPGRGSVITEYGIKFIAQYLSESSL